LEGIPVPSETEFRQAGRLLQITTPLGPDAFVLRRLRVREAVSAPFVIEAEAISAREAVEPSQMLGQSITCTVSREHVAPRHFNGICTAFGQTGAFARGLTRYRIELRPKLWNLSRAATCKVWQGKTVQDVFNALVTTKHSAGPVRWGSSATLSARPYLVQYNETDLDFLQRILEESGQGYFFRHAEGSHTLTVAGPAADWPTIPGDPVTVRADDEALFDSLTEFRPLTALRPGKVTALDYDELNPSALLKAEAPTKLGTPNAATYEIFRWPGGQHTRPDAQPARSMMEGAEAGADRFTARGGTPLVFAGGKLAVKRSIDAASPENLLVLEALHEAFDETQLAAGGSADYRVSLELMPGDRPPLPPLPRPRPVMPGLHIALVTGPEGEEIHTDEHGRVKIRFLWDRTPGEHDATSCWVRVAQPFAGAWGGSWFLPRVGDEVLVGFVDGDPDIPVVVGSLYNAEAAPPFALPSKKNLSGFRTKSTKQGGDDNFNQLYFDDTKGKEEVNFQAERDFNLLIKRNRTEEVKEDRDETVLGKHTETITKDRTLTVKEGNNALEVSKGNWALDTKMGNISTKAGMGNISTKADMGNIEVKAALGSITEEAMQKIVLKVGGNSITIDQTGIEIKGIMIKIAASAMYEIKGPLGQVKADAMLIIKGGLVMIN
jgi:type VI secretion system secreted protein VgrG